MNQSGSTNQLPTSNTQMDRQVVRTDNCGMIGSDEQPLGRFHRESNTVITNTQWNHSLFVKHVKVTLTMKLTHLWSPALEYFQFRPHRNSSHLPNIGAQWHNGRYSIPQPDVVPCFGSIYLSICRFHLDNRCCISRAGCYRMLWRAHFDNLCLINVHMGWTLGWRYISGDFCIRKTSQDKYHVCCLDCLS